MKLRFDVYTLDEASRQLLSGDRELHLSPKAFDLLAALIKARPRVLSKRELTEQLWPGTFVTSASLGMLVTEVRGALDDDPRRARFVRTVHRIGYAFKGQATEVAEPAPQPAVRAETTYWLASPTRQIRLAPGENLVGRDPSTAVWIDAADISRHHARITVDGDRVTLEDLGSRNGTFVRRVPVTAPVVLTDGDDIQFATVSLIFRVWTEADTVESV